MVHFLRWSDGIAGDDCAVAGHGGLSSHSGAIPGNRLDTAPRGGVAVAVNLKAAPVVAGLQRFPFGQGRPERVRNRRSANVFSEQAAPCVDVAQPAAKLLTGRSVRNSLSIQQQQARHKLR